MKIAVVGDDARASGFVGSISGSENQVLAIGEKINPQIARMARFSIATLDPLELVRILRMWSPEIVLISSEKYLARIGDQNGTPISIVDLLEQAGVSVVAPSYQPSCIELDKSWMIRLLRDHGLGKYLPRSEIFYGAGDSKKICDTIDEWKDVAVKPAGLTEGKGVRVTGIQLQSIEDAKKYARELLSQGHIVVIQKKICGNEFTVQRLIDKYGYGASIQVPIVQDFKNLNDGLAQPNPFTGGMGSLSDINGFLPFLTVSDIKDAENIIDRTIRAIEEETGIPYKGPIYGQFMRTEEGVKLIEFNARLGNSEAINVLMLLFQYPGYAEICRSITEGTLYDMDIKFQKSATVCKYVVPKGYGIEKKPNPVVLEMDECRLPVQMDFGGVIEDDEGNLTTTGSRAVAISAMGENRRIAAETVNQAIQKIFAPCLDKLHWRPGIGME